MAEKGRGPLSYRPQIYPDLMAVWEAWQRLSPSRSLGMSAVGGIGFEAIDRYATRYGVEDFEAFHRLILAMDATYLDHVNTRDDG